MSSLRLFGFALPLSQLKICPIALKSKKCIRCTLQQAPKLVEKECCLPCISQDV